MIKLLCIQGVKDVGADIEFGDKKLPYPYKKKIPQPKETRENPKDTTDVKEITSGMDDGLSSTNHSSTPEYSIVHRGHLDLQNFTNARYVQYLDIFRATKRAEQREGNLPLAPTYLELPI